MSKLNIFKSAKFGALALCVGLLSITASSQADESTSKHFGIQESPFTIDEYARVGTRIKITTDEFLAVDASATLECTGGAGKGGWRVVNTTGKCWTEYTVADCDEDSCVERTISENPVDSNDVIMHAFHKCDSPHASKNYCIHDYDGRIGITGDTGDDMFKLEADGGGAFFEYKNLGETDPYRMKYYEWNSAAGGISGKGLMIPSGPPTSMTRTDADGNTITVPPYGDYKSFVDNRPSFVKVDSACFPITLSLCDEEPPAGTGLAEDGACGKADISRTPGGYASQLEIGAGDYCDGGTRGTVTDAGSGMIQWQCMGLPAEGGGADSPICKAKIQVPDPFCGEAHMREYASLSALQALEEEKLCSVGTFNSAAGFSTTPDGDGWGWSCKNNVNATVDCSAIAEAADCTSLQTNTNVVLVQDTSGSFADDIPNIRNAFIDLFNQPAMLEWNIGITHYNTTLSGGYDSLTPGFLSNHGEKTQILNHIQSLSGLIWGSEDPFVGLDRAIDEYLTKVPAGESFTVILVSDETDTGSVEAGGSGNVEDYFYDAKDKMIANDIKFMVLATSGVSGFYVPYSNQVPEGQTLIISSDSSDLSAAMLAGLIDVNCE